MTQAFICDVPDEFVRHIQSVLDGEYGIPFPADYETILDLGANIGAFTFWAAQKYPRARIYAYEPNLNNANAFKKNMNDSCIPLYRYELHNVAVTTKPGPTVTLFEGAFNSGMHSLNADLAAQSVETFDAKVLHPKDLPSANFVKVDTEGCEIEIISAYLEVGHRPTQISYEFHSLQDRLTLEDLMKKYDYILCSGFIQAPVLGTMNFVHKNSFRFRYNEKDYVL